MSPGVHWAILESPSLPTIAMVNSEIISPALARDQRRANNLVAAVTHMDLPEARFPRTTE